MAKKGKAKKAKNSKTSTVKKKTVKEVKKVEDKKINKIVKEETIKQDEKKNIESPVKEKIKKRKKNNKKSIKYLIITFIFIILTVVMVLVNNKSYNNSVSFISKNNFITSPSTNKFNAPVYAFAIDEKGNPIDIPNIKFLDNKMSYDITDTKREVLDDDNILMTINYEMTTNIEYIEIGDVEEEWFRSISYEPIISFDYNTGEIYLENSISDSKKKDISDDDMKYTEIMVHGKEVKIGVLNNTVESKWESTRYEGNHDDGKHYVTVNKIKVVTYLKAPKSYDGLMLAISKKGMDYDSWKKDYEYETKIKELEKNIKDIESSKNKKKDKNKDHNAETNEKFKKELETLLKEKDIIHKLIDKDDKTRKDYTKDDFYVIRVADMFKDDYTITKEDNTNFLCIIGIVALVLASITSFAMFIKERQ